MLYSRRQYNLCEELLVVCRLDNIQFVLNTHILNHDVPRYTTHAHIVYLRFKLQKKNQPYNTLFIRLNIVIYVYYKINRYMLPTLTHIHYNGTLQYCYRRYSIPRIVFGGP